jgi:hypothetical protein
MTPGSRQLADPDIRFSIRSGPPGTLVDVKRRNVSPHETDSTRRPQSFTVQESGSGRGAPRRSLKHEVPGVAEETVG